jgi:Zn-dependent peptidase ImmA (M78 family)/transcriptional regulator with XRE-family HTH domain
LIETHFEAARLRLGRELKGWSQAELARSLGVTAQAISQFESGATRPGPSTVERLGTLLDVPPLFFSLPLTETHEGFFRSLRRTSVTERRRARAIAHIAHDIAVASASRLEVPKPTVPDLPVDNLQPDTELLESVADAVRRQWKLPRGPVSDVVALLEAHGIVVIRLPLITADVDAFSLPFRDRPVVVLGADKQDRARSRFDAAHELGHLVVHGEHVWGLKEVEQQAHMFAAAFLMPARDIRGELPTRADWPVFFELKQKWQVSIAALLMRAKTLERMSEANYLTAIKAASARGWRRREPVPLGEPEQPQLIHRLLAKPARKSALPPSVLSAIAGAAD